MEEKEAPIVPKADPAASEDGTPNRPRQAGNGNSRKQPRAAKQLRFEAPATGILGTHGIRNVWSGYLLCLTIQVCTVDLLLHLTTDSLASNGCKATLFASQSM